MPASKDTPSSTRSTNSSTLVWVDALKGIGIVLVVLGHAIRGAYGRNLLSWDVFHALDTRIYSFHMPLFFVVSGLFLRSTILRDRPLNVSRNLLKRILYPLALWTYVFLLLKYVAGNYTNSPVSLSDLLVLPIPGREHLWFLWALFLGQLVVLVAHMIAPYARPVPFAIGLFAFAIGLYFVPLPSGLTPWFGQGVFGLPFLAFGLLIGTQIRHLSASIPLGWGALSLCLILLVFTPWIYTVLLLPIAVIALLGCVTLAFQNTITMKSFAVFGKASMAIYLTHTIFSAGFREALLLADVTNATLHLSIATFVGLFGGLLLHRAAHRCGVSQLLGFR